MNRRTATSALVLGLAAAGPPLIAAVPAAAADLTITPRVAVEETWTDNVRSTTSNEQSDFVTTTSAGVGVRADGNNADLLFDYDVAYDLYADADDLNGIRHDLRTVGESQLIEDHLFLDVYGALNQQTVTTTGPVSATDRTTAGGQKMVLSYGIAPTWRQRLGDVADAQVGYELSGVDYMESDVGDAGSGYNDAVIHTFTGRLTRADETDRLRLYGDARREFTDRRDTNDMTRTTVSGRGEYWVVRQAAILGTVGWDDIESDVALSDDVDGAFWMVGGIWKPSPRTYLEAQIGRRFDAVTGDLKATWDITERTSLVASYDSAVTTQQEQQIRDLRGYTLGRTEAGDLALIDPSGRPVPGQDALALLQPVYVDTLFRAQTFSVGLDGTRGRTSFHVTARYTERDFGLVGGGSDETLGLEGSVGHRLAPDLDASLSAAAVRTSTDGISTDTTAWRTSLQVAYIPVEDVQLAGALHHLERDANEDLTENAVTVRLSMRF